MDIEVLLRVVAIVIAASLLFVNFDIKPYLSYVRNLFKRKPRTTPEVQVASASFIEVVETWHTLRNQCESLELKSAVEKIDEVFPLLNTEE
tara:strand:- start:882 stop:1154 length:273 start_codon:yes stop_codon:yes gene_type:complete